MRMLPVLAFVPPELVVWSFEHLVTVFPVYAFPLSKYFEETYIGLRNANGSRNPPLFPIHLWNIFHLVPQGLPRWHRGFLTTCGCHHPTIWKFIEALKTEQASVNSSS